jgi:hypothetical protein
MSNKQRIQVAESAMLNGIEKASSYFNIDPSLIEKWIKKLDLLKIRSEIEIAKNKANGAKNYKKLSLEKKKLKNK